MTAATLAEAADATAEAAEAAEEASPGDERGRVLEALRPAVMRARLAAELGLPGRACHVLDAKYEPGLRATVLYRCDGLLVRGDVRLGGPLRCGQGGPGEPAPPPPGRHVAPGVSLSVFPSDPDLPWLPDALDAHRCSAELRAVLGAPRAAAPDRIALLRYRPGRRVTVAIRPRGAGGTLIAKIYHDPAKAAAVAAEGRALMAAGVSAPLRIARTVAEVSAFAMVLQEPLQGVPFDALSGDARGSGGALPDAARRVGWALAALHATTPVSARVRSLDAELLRFGARARRVAAVAPRLGGELDRLADRLAASEPSCPAGRVGLVHGDCKPSAFWLAGAEVALLDLDHCGVAEQLGDLGTFLASLRQQAVRLRLAGAGPARAEGLVVLGEAFLGGYAEASGQPDAAERARWHEAVALERKALRGFARAPNSPLPGALVEEAHRCLDRVLGDRHMGDRHMGGGR